MQSRHGFEFFSGNEAVSMLVVIGVGRDRRQVNSNAHKSTRRSDLASMVIDFERYAVPHCAFSMSPIKSTSSKSIL